jgi:ABC-2 type transport system permease protein
MSSANNIRQLHFLVMTHLKEIIREPGVLFWGIGFPILMSIGLGIAFTKKPETVRKIGVVEVSGSDRKDSLRDFPLQEYLELNAKTVDGRREGHLQREIEIKDDLLGSTSFIFQMMGWDEAMVLLKRGNFNLILDDRTGKIEYHFDPMNPDAQLSFLKLSMLFTGEKPASLADGSLIRPMTIKGTRYIDFFIPGLIGMGIMMSSMWGLSYGIIEKRSKKLLRRLVATPMKKSFFLMSMVVTRVAMNFIESLLLLLFAWLAFGINVNISWPALIIMFIAGNIAFAGLAILISSHTAKPEIGNGFINAVVFPMMILSGIFFSYHNFPDWSIPVIGKMPLTLLADGIRSVFNEGAGLAQIAMPAGILTVAGLFLFMVGLKIFKWY